MVTIVDPSRKYRMPNSKINTGLFQIMIRDIQAMRSNKLLFRICDIDDIIMLEIARVHIQKWNEFFIKTPSGCKNPVIYIALRGNQLYFFIGNEIPRFIINMTCYWLEFCGFGKIPNKEANGELSFYVIKCIGRN